jgi:hypothetical protein
MRIKDRIDILQRELYTMRGGACCAMNPSIRVEDGKLPQGDINFLRTQYL